MVWIYKFDSSSQVGLIGLFINFILASSKFLHPFFLLHLEQAQTTFSHTVLPPKAFGITWSIVNGPFFKQDGYNEAVTSCKITDVGIDINDAGEFFDDVKSDLRKLVGVSDLNRNLSTYHPIRLIW